MRFASVTHQGKWKAVAVIDAGYVDLSDIISTPQDDPMIALLREVGGDALAKLDISGLPVIPIADAEIAPVVRKPGKIVAAPVNYADHQEEMKQVGDVSALGFFLKSPQSVLAHGGTVRLPYTDRRFDQEGELAIVIGRRASKISAAEVIDHIAGFTVALDMTMRGGEDRSIRKSFDTFTPIGPDLVTPDEVSDLRTLTLQTRVNGTLRQDANIADLIWDVDQFVSYASSVTTLEPGDILLTGTPAGIGAVGDGDHIECVIGNVGALSVTVSDSGATSCPTRGAGSGPVPPEDVTPVRSRN